MKVDGSLIARKTKAKQPAESAVEQA